ncbi:MAG: redoxin domain-containing protein, partial [Pseudomonadota bacterium]
RLGIVAGMSTAVIFTAGALIAFSAHADAPAISEPAPAFTGTTATGETLSLSDFEGSTVVLEWTNHDCPFVKKHYDAEYANMQTLQSGAAADDVVWISVISSAPGKQGHVSSAEALALSDARSANPAHILIDESGDIGRAYAAKTTPHMYVIEPDGNLAYDGAIDSISSARTSDIPTATNYVTAALTAVAAGEAADPGATKPYGCSVKY